MSGRIKRYRASERDDTRPLTIAVFTPRFRHSRSTFGQISPSTSTSSRGRALSRTRRTAHVKSIGKKKTASASLNCRRARFWPAAVVVDTNSRKPG